MLHCIMAMLCLARVPEGTLAPQRAPCSAVCALLCKMVYVCWCSDEIYANSIFKKAQFVSLATILDQSSAALQEKGRLLVHTVFGLSKDW